MRRFMFVYTCLVAMASQASAIDIYVDNLLGDDRRAGTSTIVSGDGVEPRLRQQLLKACLSGQYGATARALAISAMRQAA